MKLRRLLLVSEPGSHGVFNFVRSLTNWLHENRPEVTVDLAYSKRRDLGEVESLASRVRERGGEAFDLGVSNAPEFRDLPAALRMAAFCRRRKVQLVHAHSSKAGALCRLLRLCPGFPPVLYTPHAYYGMAHHHGLRERIYNLLEQALGPLGKTHSTSGDERDFALDTLGLSARSLVLIHSGLPTQKFNPAGPAQRAAARSTLGIPTEGKLLVTIGRDVTQKHYQPLYLALNRFLPGKEIQFGHAGGSTALRDRLSLEAQVRYHRWEHLPDTSILLQAADGFILTSLYEGMSLVVLQALLCGLPMILTDVPGNRAIKRLGFNNVSWLPNPLGSESLEQAILTALESWTTLPPGPISGQHEVAQSWFTEEVQFGKLFRLYQSMS